MGFTPKIVVLILLLSSKKRRRVCALLFDVGSLIKPKIGIKMKQYLEHLTQSRPFHGSRPASGASLEIGRSNAGAIVEFKALVKHSSGGPLGGRVVG